MDQGDGSKRSAGEQTYIAAISDKLQRLRARYARGDVLPEDHAQWQEDVLQEEQRLHRAKRPPLTPARGATDHSFDSIGDAVDREMWRYTMLSSEARLERLDDTVALIDEAIQRVNDAVCCDSTFKTRTSALMNLVRIAELIVGVEGKPGKEIRKRYRHDERVVTSMLYIMNDCMTTSERWFLCEDNEDSDVQACLSDIWWDMNVRKLDKNLFNGKFYDAVSAIDDGIFERDGIFQRHNN